ncbi:acetoin utilization protein AcuC [Acidithiobacillus sp. IBUN Pt1247-S3]|uniref:acetoin utilization protein AcuC n=1 Tax=Acidithiobacillus sp. IBUN Pt1247-S3 TaxID=3166642 RepID=UPI0034E384B9
MNELDLLHEQISPTRPALFVGAARYRRKSYGKNHPLAIPRVSLTLDLINSYGAMGPNEYRLGRPASHIELWGFHTRDYIQAFEKAQFLGRVTDHDRRAYQLGTLENPCFPGFFDTPNLATGSSIQAAEFVLQGQTAFSPAGGMHHAAPHQARGFCYLNDPVLAIQRLRRAGLRVLYWDLDAHHGDGVEAAFIDDPEVQTVSIHMDTSNAYPFHGGSIADQAGGALNLPLPPEVNDSEYREVFDAFWPRVLEVFVPDVVVLQAGTDILAPDPLSKFRISNVFFWEMVERILTDSPRLLVLGGGGYHPIALARCWTGLWAILSGRTLSETLPEAGRALLKEVDWELDDEDAADYSRQFERLDDLPLEGSVRAEIAERLRRLLQQHPLFTDRRVLA